MVGSSTVAGRACAHAAPGKSRSIHAATTKTRPIDYPSTPRGACYWTRPLIAKLCRYFPRSEEARRRPCRDRSWPAGRSRRSEGGYDISEDGPDLGKPGPSVLLPGSCASGEEEKKT